MAVSGTFRVAALGASAGGLEAFRGLLSALPPDTGMAFLLVQHLDPTHASFMVSLLASHTAMAVSEAGEGSRLEPNKVYVIPPGRYLTVSDGELHLSPIEGGGRARMPFDMLLESLAETYGERAACAVLTGTGSDGSLGARAILQRGGLTIAQDPAEAEFDGMPRSAIALGAVSLVLPLAQIADELAGFARRGSVPAEGADTAFMPNTTYARIIDLLRQKTAHDFDLHKRGTMMRRIRRRMGLASIEDPARYLELLETDPAELRSLADDLFINVTRFFRDAPAFSLLASKVIPDLIREHPSSQPFRAWVAGCSTGEEAYSIAMILCEAIIAAGRNIKLTVFASDIDEEAIAFARDGLYPATIEADVSAARLARFFVKKDQGYRVVRSLRDLVVFSVHDLLSDAPFSRVDLVSCCNLLIYLRPEVQQQVLGLFHFALGEGGILFLGSAGSIGEAADRFEPISEKDRIYRHIGRSRPGEVELPIGRGGLARALWPRPVRRPLVRRPGVGELAQRLLLESYAPASVVTNLRNEGIYYFGPIDRYLRLPEGEASQAILATAREGLRRALRSAIEKATHGQERATVTGGQVRRDGETYAVTITVQPVKSDGEQLLLVSFSDEPPRPVQPSRGMPAAAAPALSDEAARIAQLERDLDAAHQELEAAARDREVAEEELKAVNEEAMSLNEEFQTTNEELQTSKEELQSLNEELTTLNAELQETVDREHAVADDLHNILFSSDVGTLFLDDTLNIRFFTPSARPLFNLIPSDIGRPMSDLARNFPDENLIGDARAVLARETPVTREITAEDGAAYMRRTLPYRTREDRVRGVVVTYVDISDVRRAEHATATARAFTAQVVGEIRAPLLVLDADLRVVTASRAFYSLLGTDPATTIGREPAAIGGALLDVPALQPFLAEIRAGSAVVAGHEIGVEMPGLGRRILVLNAVDIPQEPDLPRRVLVAIDDITGRRQAQNALRVAETANLSKSRFLAAAGHDLRQPVQTLNLLQGMLAKKVEGRDAKLLTERMAESLRTMSEMLDTLLGISQLEAGIVEPDLGSFAVGPLLERLKAEFAPQASARGLRFRLMPCPLAARSDPRLVEQILRNLLSNAIKYTDKGGVLLGWRRRGGAVRIEVWDTGIGIPAEQLQAIFEEFHQVGNEARQAGRGVGLGLAIVRRLADLLGHEVEVRSRPGRGSVFAVMLPLVPAEAAGLVPAEPAPEAARTSASILVIEDDEMLRDLFDLFLREDGYHVAAAGGGPQALALVTTGFQPEAVVADYNLPGGMNGVEAVLRLREALGRPVPALILTGDVSREAAADIARQGIDHCVKPLRPAELSRRLAAILATGRGG